jgi:hypothetical protein
MTQNTTENPAVKRTSLTVAVAVVAPIATVVLLVWVWLAQSPAEATTEQVSMTTMTAMLSNEMTAEPGLDQAPQNPVNEQQFLIELTEKFAPVISVKHAQIRMLEQLISYLKAKYPQDWQSRVEAMLMQMYPDRGAELVAKYQAWANYNEWLVTERDVLRAMSVEERRDALWAKRFDAFGADAELIWAAELRNRQIEDALQEAGNFADGDSVQKLNHFLVTVEGVLGDRTETLLKTRQTELMNRFLALATVQQELRQIPAERRLQSLAAIRSGLGMDAEAVGRWSELDQRRDQAWTIGANYMQQRQQLVLDYEGVEQHDRISALQNGLFAGKAELIQREEQGGFFRYGGERHIGKE